jgi:hypothetical protein
MHSQGYNPAQSMTPADHTAIRALLRGLVTADPEPLREMLAAGGLDGDVAAWLRAQGLAPFAFQRLREAGLASARDEIQRSYYRSVADALLHDHELGRVLAVLAGVGITPVLLKGAALAHTVYPTSACRPMGDLDLWVTSAEMSAAQAALEQIGYAQRVKSARPVALQAQQEGEIQMVSQRPGGGLVELHWGAFPGQWLRHTSQVDVSGILARLVSVEIVGLPARILAPEDSLIQVAVHMAINHQMSSPWLRGLLDVTLLARGGAFDWAAVVARARAWRVATATWLVLWLAADLLGLAEAEPVVAGLAPSALRRRQIGRFCNARTMLEMRRINSSPARFLYQLSVVDRLSDAVRLLGRALWPEAGWLEARYGSAGRAVRRRHFLSALRGQV